MPGGPRISIPYLAAVAIISSGSGRLQGRRREGEGRRGLGEGANEALEAGGLGDKEETGLV